MLQEIKEFFHPEIGERREVNEIREKIRQVRSLTADYLDKKIELETYNASLESLKPIFDSKK
jgi:hypothetical protein